MTGYRAILLAILLASLPGLRPAHAQERYIYWIGAINEEQTIGDTICRYSLDSGVIDTLVHGPAVEADPNLPRSFYYLTVDTLRGHIYWTDSGGTNPDKSVNNGAIMRASLDGNSIEIILGGITCGLGGPSDIEIDVAGNTLYWGEASECYDYALNKVDLGSTPSEEWHLLPVSQGYVVEGIELDIHNQMIYWVTSDLFPDPPPGIVRAPLNDTLNDEYILSGCVGDIALAHMLSKIYWSPCNSSQIMRADLDGSNIEDVVDGQGVIGNLAVDHKGGKLYWTEPAEGMIWRADLDGTEVENLLSGLVVPTSIALNFGWDVHVNVEPKTALPDRVGLRGIHPNPIREGTTIDFALTEPAHVTLEIYDQLGRRVDILSSGTYLAGTHQLRWHPTHLANGAYYLRMISDRRPETRIVVIQR